MIVKLFFKTCFIFFKILKIKEIFKKNYKSYMSKFFFSKILFVFI